MEKISSSLFLCVCVGWRFFPSLSRSRFTSHSLSLSLTLLLTSAAVMWRDNIVYYPSLTPLQSSEG